MIVKLI